MGTYSSLSVCVLNTDACGKLLVKSGVGVLRGFKLAQYDKLKGDFNLLRVSKLLVRHEQKSFYTAWLSDVLRYIPSVSEIHKTCVCIWEQRGPYEKSEESELGFFLCVCMFKSIRAV